MAAPDGDGDGEGAKAAPSGSKPRGLWGVVKASKVDLLVRMLKEKDEHIASLTREMECARHANETEGRSVHKQLLHQKLQLGLYKAEREEARNECRVLRERVRYYEQKSSESVVTGDPDSEMHQLQASKHLLLIRISNLEDKYYALRGKYKEFFLYLDTRVKIAQHSISEVRSCVHNEIAAMRHWIAVQSRITLQKAQLVHGVDWDIPHDARVLQSHVANLVQEANTMLETYRSEMLSSTPGTAASSIVLPTVNPARLSGERVVKSEYTLQITGDTEEKERIDAFTQQIRVIGEVAKRLKGMEVSIVNKRSFQAYQLRAAEVSTVHDALRQEGKSLIRWFADHLDQSVVSLRTAGLAFQHACSDASASEVNTVQYLVHSSQQLSHDLTTLNLRRIVLKTSHDVYRRRNLRFTKPTACCEKTRKKCIAEMQQQQQQRAPDPHNLSPCPSPKAADVAAGLFVRKPSVMPVVPTTGLTLLKAANRYKEQQATKVEIPPDAPQGEDADGAASPPPASEPPAEDSGATPRALSPASALSGASAGSAAAPSAAKSKFQKSLQKHKLLKTIGGFAKKGGEGSNNPSPAPPADPPGGGKKKLGLLDISSMMSARAKIKKKFQMGAKKASDNPTPSVETSDGATGTQTIPEDTCPSCRLKLTCIECAYSGRLETLYPSVLLGHLTLVKQRINEVDQKKIEIWNKRNDVLREMVDLLRFSGRVVSDAPAKLRQLENAVQRITTTDALSSSAPPAHRMPHPGLQDDHPGMASQLGQDDAPNQEFMPSGLVGENGAPTPASRLVLKHPAVVPLLQQQYHRERELLAERGRSPELPRGLGLGRTAADTRDMPLSIALGPGGWKGLLAGILKGGGGGGGGGGVGPKSPRRARFGEAGGEAVASRPMSPVGASGKRQGAGGPAQQGGTASPPGSPVGGQQGRTPLVEGGGDGGGAAPQSGEEGVPAPAPAPPEGAKEGKQQAVVRLPKAPEAAYFYVASSVVEQRKRVLLKKRDKRAEARAVRQRYAEDVRRLSPRPPNAGSQAKARAALSHLAEQQRGLQSVPATPAPAIVQEPVDIYLDTQPSASVLWDGTGFSQKDTASVAHKLQAAASRREVSAVVPRFPCLR